jgi:prepilin-type processing-associated H-X9-DG protein
LNLDFLVGDDVNFPYSSIQIRQRSTTSNTDGVAWLQSRVTFTEITDGLSNTFLFLELENGAVHSWLPAKTGSNPFFFVHHPSEGYVNSNTNGSATPAAPNDTTNNDRGAQGPHPGGVCAVMCDGHVVWVPNTISVNVYSYGFTRAGGESIPDF